MAHVGLEARAGLQSKTVVLALKAAGKEEITALEAERGELESEVDSLIQTLQQKKG